MTKPREYLQWLMKYWGRISEWPQIGRP
jgi:hypothetical protein